MAILVYLETENQSLKKSAPELASYAKALSGSEKTIGLCVNAKDAEGFNAYGLDELIVVDRPAQTISAEEVGQLVAAIAEEVSADKVIIGSSADARYYGSLIASRLGAAYIPNVTGTPEEHNGELLYKRSVFTNKGYAYTAASAAKIVIGLAKNAFEVRENQQPLTISQRSFNFDAPKVQSEGVEKASGKATIADADVVVSAGRGLKGPENWGMIEELAEVLGAATACSKPVSDLGWRPHGEHVGQTGKPVATNLYIAIGISGAIQHLAGINASKVKVVINNDPEAPFFKAADYGIVGDAFEVVPALIEKLKHYKAQTA
ncbi:MAG: electron transfer flavoprotein subunit alpha/FixB family protein [Flavobacteriaceae bacterium]